MLRGDSQPPELLGGPPRTADSDDYQPSHLYEFHGNDAVWLDPECGFCPFFKMENEGLQLLGKWNRCTFSYSSH